MQAEFRRSWGNSPQWQKCTSITTSSQVDCCLLIACPWYTTLPNLVFEFNFDNAQARFPRSWGNSPRWRNWRSTGTNWLVRFCLLIAPRRYTRLPLTACMHTNNRIRCDNWQLLGILTRSCQTYLVDACCFVNHRPGCVRAVHERASSTLPRLHLNTNTSHESPTQQAPATKRFQYTLLYPGRRGFRTTLFTPSLVFPCEGVANAKQ